MISGVSMGASLRFPYAARRSALFDVTQSAIRAMHSAGRDSMGPNTHIGEAFYHADDATAVEVLTVFPDGFNGQQRGQVVEVRSMGVFLFDGDKMHTEKLYADVSPPGSIHALARRGLIGASPVDRAGVYGAPWAAPARKAPAAGVPEPPDSTAPRTRSASRAPEADLVVRWRPR
jgi:hypothetical protein